MNCRNCKQPVLDKNLLCPECIRKLSHRSILKQQKDFLPAVIARDNELRIVRHNGKHDWHIEMLGWPNQAYCGVLFEKRAEKELKAFSLVRIREDLCPECEKALAACVKEIAVAEVA